MGSRPRCARGHAAPRFAVSPGSESKELPNAVPPPSPGGRRGRDGHGLSALQAAPAVAMPVRDYVLPPSESAVQLPGVGDSPSDRLGSGAAVPATIRVVGPERTVVHDDVDAVPTVVASVALLVTIAGAGYTLVTVRSLRRSLFS